MAHIVKRYGPFKLPKLKVISTEEGDSKLNKELFTKGREIMEENVSSPQGGDYIGWQGFGLFIDWLEDNYEIKKK